MTEKKREKWMYLPEASSGEILPVEETEPETEQPDVYDRPDFAAVWPEQETEEEPCDPVTGLPLEPCACCGAEVIPQGSMAYICPVCWWETDVFLTGEDEPSDQNHGLTLFEARMNFQTFGIADPSLRWPESPDPALHWPDDREEEE